MNADSVKRIVACKRQIAVYNSMVRRGDLLEIEANALIVPLEREIQAIRGQAELPVVATKAK